MKMITRLTQFTILVALGVVLVTGAFARSKPHAVDRSLTHQSAPAADKAVPAQDVGRSAPTGTPSEPAVSSPATTPAPEAVPVPSRERGPSVVPSGTAVYTVTWQSVNAGGGVMSSTSYAVQSSAGQAAIGYATSAAYEAGIGYWYGVTGGGGGCSCPYQGDMNNDGMPDAVDLNAVIDALFFNGANPQDPDCPRVRADVNADNVPDAVDLNYVIDWLFFNGPEPVDPCGL